MYFIAEGQYAVTQEIIEIFKYILCHKTHIKWNETTNDGLSKIILSLNERSIEEIDLWFSFIPGGNFDGLRAG